MKKGLLEYDKDGDITGHGYLVCVSIVASTLIASANAVGMILHAKSHEEWMVTFFVSALTFYFPVSWLANRVRAWWWRGKP